MPLNEKDVTIDIFSDHAPINRLDPPRKIAVRVTHISTGTIVTVKGYNKSQLIEIAMEKLESFLMAAQNKCPKCKSGKADWLGTNIINEIDKETGHYKEFDRCKCCDCGHIWRELIKGGLILEEE